MLHINRETSKFITGVRRIEALEREEEVALFNRWKSTKDSAARERVLTATLRHVTSIAIMFGRYPIPVEDLISEGSLGLLKAFDRFDLEEGTRFVTYAGWWIKAYMLRAILANHDETRTQAPQRSSIFFRYRRERARSLALYGDTEEARKDLAKRLDIPFEKLESVSKAMDLADYSLDSPGNDDNSPLSDLIPSTSEDPEYSAEANEKAQIAKAIVQAALKHLDKRERYIAEQRIMQFEDSLTLAEIGNKFGISRERARQLEERTKKKLRYHLSQFRFLSQSLE